MHEFSFTIRDIEKEDISSGNFLETLENLSSHPTKNKQLAYDILKQIRSNPFHRIFIAVLDRNEHIKKNVIGSTTLLVEPKFIYNGGSVGHLEDVVVKKGYEGKGIGKKLIEHAMHIATTEFNCVKIVLDCSDQNIAFYQKLGYSYQDNCMAIRFIKKF
jgi:glucosamine-phosphate N-acetyltransferase